MWKEGFARMTATKRKLGMLVVLVATLGMISVTGGGAATSATCTIKGTAKNDVLLGTKKADVICGLKGNDTIRGLAGNDTLVGGPGNDVIFGGVGRDVLIGGGGNDSFFANDAQADRVSGGAGKDKIVADPVDVLLGIETVKYIGAILTQFNFRGAEFTVGSKGFTEQLILGHITKRALEFAGAKINNQIGLGGTSVNRQALVSGKIDMYWEYTGTGWIVHLNRVTPVQGSRAQYTAVKNEDAKNGITWLAPAPFDNTYAFAVRKEAVTRLGVKKISDFKTLIQRRPNDATLCANNEFLTRDDGLPGVEKSYGFRFPRDKVSNVDLGLIYQLVDEGKCNFGEVFATDGRIEGLGLFVLQDDKQFFPVYNPSLNVRTSVFQRHPRLAKMFDVIAKELTTERMQRMNADVDIRGKFPEQVAEAFLKSRQLIK